MKTQKYLPLLSTLEISQIFEDGLLYEQNSFFVISKKSLTYDTQRTSNNFLEEAQYIRSSFLNGHTVVVKNLENYSKAIKTKCIELGGNVDVHLYLGVSDKALSFPFHKDDRDVLVHLLYGEKVFYFSPEDKQILLKKGGELFIGKGQLHRAKPRMATCLLSFGIAERLTYPILGGIQVSDLPSMD